MSGKNSRKGSNTDDGARRYASVILRYIVFSILHFIRYLIFPILVVGSVLFLIGLTISFVVSSFQTLNTNFAFNFSLLFSIMVSVVVFGLKTMEKLADFLGKNRRLISLKKKLPEVKISIRTRLSLKPYLFSLTVTAALLSFSFFLIAFSTKSDDPTFLNSGEFLIGLALYFCMGLFWTAYRVVYEETQKAAYFLKKFSKDIDRYLLEDNVRPNLRDFVEALKSYQKALPAFFMLKDRRKRIMQMGLILNRGTREEIKELQGYLKKIGVSIQNKDKPSIDEHFSRMIQLLEKVEKDKQKILELAVTSRREETEALLREIGKQILYKVVPTLVLIGVGLALYMFLGYKLEFA